MDITHVLSIKKIKHKVRAHLEGKIYSGYCLYCLYTTQHLTTKNYILIMLPIIF